MGSRRRHSLVSMTLCVLTVGIAASGCATAGTESRHGLGVGEWQARLPTTASPIHELAYGRGGSSLASADTLDLDLDTPDDVLLPSTTKVAVAKPAAKPTARRAVVAKMDAPVAPEAAQPQLAAVAQPEAQLATDAAPVLLASNDADARYAQRETKAEEQQKFRGGDAIVISAGAVVIVLLIVILILLLR